MCYACRKQRDPFDDLQGSVGITSRRQSREVKAFNSRSPKIQSAVGKLVLPAPNSLHLNNNAPSERSAGTTLFQRAIVAEVEISAATNDAVRTIFAVLRGEGGNFLQLATVKSSAGIARFRNEASTYRCF
ncbi:hypothetical protein CDAR_483041 [Caerostris darwini]|uniref:Uncharacterized protein n=1 Tax=Caerostris darwini TaxID=1538125 RepID=A0AAV4V4R4_9ARAC|nr:hypothetical protein CDAR_483041 [Caerostris darwini]